MTKYVVSVTTNDADSAENVLKHVHTAVETNPSLDVDSVKVEPAAEQASQSTSKVVNGCWGEG